MDEIAVRAICMEMRRQAIYQDGLATIPAYLLEQLNNVVFPEFKQHEFTVPDGGTL